jgi:alcohol dehydrogenase
MACGDPTAAAKIALLDPELTVSAPRRVTAMAGYDAIAHAVETWVTTKRTPISEAFSKRSWELLSGSFKRVLSHPSDLEARSAMLAGAHFAGTAIELSMLGAAHACSNPLTARYNLAHGQALSILLPIVVRWNAVSVGDRYAGLAGSTEALALELERFAAVAGLGGTLKDQGAKEEDVPELAALAAQQWTGTFNPRPFDAAGAVDIYKAAL